MSEILEFTCEIEKMVYHSPDYKIYGALVDDREYPFIKLNQYGSATIVGNLHDLSVGITYHIKAKEKENKKHGKQYEVVNIRRDKPKNKTQTKRFLHEVITHKQADVLLDIYPDIVDRIINNNLLDIDLSLTKGIKDATFEKIKSKVIENFSLVEVVERYGGYGITFPMLKKLYDKYTSVEKLEKELKKDPYKSLCGISGIGFKKADGIISSIPAEILGIDYDLKTSRQRMKSCILFLLEENESEGNTKIDVRDLRNECQKLTPECMNYFVDIIKEDEEIFFNKIDKSIARKIAYDTEYYISQKINEMLISPVVYKFDWNYYNEISGDKLTDQQLNVLKNLCEYNISLLSGFAGSGKSFTTQAAIHMLEDNKLTYKLMSPTGKAAKVLSNYTGKDATTIHRGLGYNPMEGWTYNEDNKLDCDVVICDETGMVDIYLMKRLFEAIDTTKTKLLFIQDPAQIPSVASGNCSEDMIQSKKIPITTLDKIFRYNEGGLYNVATKIRNGEYYIKDESKRVQSFGESKDYALISISQDDVVSSVANLYEKLLKNGESISDIMVLSHHNKGDYGTKAINNIIQSRVNPKDNKKWIKHGETIFVEGDKVLQIVNNYKAKTPHGEETSIYNGNTGTIKEVGWNEITVDFDGELIIYPKDDLSQLLLGYAISIHKSQGDSAKNVIVVTPDAHTYFINRNLLYTAITRTKKQCYHISNCELIKTALKKSITKERQTFLKELLKTNNK